MFFVPNTKLSNRLKNSELSLEELKEITTLLAKKKDALKVIKACLKMNY